MVTKDELADLFDEIYESYLAQGYNHEESVINADNEVEAVYKGLNVKKGK